MEPSELIQVGEGVHFLGALRRSPLIERDQVLDIFEDEFDVGQDLLPETIFIGST